MRRSLSFLALSAVIAVSALYASCAQFSSLRAPKTPVAKPTESARPIPYPIFESQAFARAVANGTRTRTGETGPKYWQQYARYTITAELIPSTNQLNGRETVRYYNRSP